MLGTTNAFCFGFALDGCACLVMYSGKKATDATYRNTRLFWHIKTFFFILSHKVSEFTGEPEEQLTPTKVTISQFEIAPVKNILFYHCSNFNLTFTYYRHTCKSGSRVKQK